MLSSFRMLKASTREVSEDPIVAGWASWGHEAAEYHIAELANLGSVPPFEGRSSAGFALLLGSVIGTRARYHVSADCFLMLGGRCRVGE